MLKSPFNKDAGFIKRRLQHRCLPVKFANFLRTPFFAEHFWWLLLDILRKIPFVSVLIVKFQISFVSQG